jgi:hypothetical protein
MKYHPTLKRFCSLAGCLLAWGAVILQLYLILANRSQPVLNTLVLFFSFFTILTNILVAVTFTAQVAGSESRWHGFMLRPGTQTAVAVYITIVGLVYNIVLRSLWDPQGLQRVVDELLHSVVPAAYLLFWFIFVPKQGLTWKQTPSWLLYPFVYLVYILIRGALSGVYPYPFVDVVKSGYSRVLLNCLVLCGVFMLFSFIFVAIAKACGRRR